MRISDWSSDVCSSDLAPSPPAGFTVDPIVAPTLSWKPRPMLEPANDRAAAAAETIRPEDVLPLPIKQGELAQPAPDTQPVVVDPPSHSAGNIEIGRASCRERVCQ